MSVYGRVLDGDNQELTDCRISKGQIDRAEERMLRKSLFAELGLCASCVHMHGEVTKYGTKVYLCTALHRPRPRSPEDPVEKCTDYGAASMLTLPMMMAMAHRIDIERKRPCGFIISNDDIDMDEDTY